MSLFNDGITLRRNHRKVVALLVTAAVFLLSASVAYLRIRRHLSYAATPAMEITGILTPASPLYGGINVEITGANLAGAVCDTGGATGGAVSYYIQDGVCWEVHTFSTSGAFTPARAIVGARALVIGGGGGGGWSDVDASTVWGTMGGGAGGFYNGAGLSFNSGTSYAATVGAGGVGRTNAGTSTATGGASSLSGAGFTTIQANGGGQGGGHQNGTAGVGSSVTNASGGGSSNNATGGSGSSATGPVYGNTGGGGNANYSAGSGGGAGGVGTGLGSATDGRGTPGGLGRYSDITGKLVCYAGGGAGSAGGSSLSAPTLPGLGGWNGTPGAAANNNACLGGGGGDSAYRATAGSTVAMAGQNGTANTGGGGGVSHKTTGGTGGSGMVIVAFPVSEAGETTAVSFVGGGTTIVCGGVSVASDGNSLTCVAPANAFTGVFDVRVSMGSQTITMEKSFSYLDPQLSPTTAATGSAANTVPGLWLISGGQACADGLTVADVSFGGKSASNILCESSGTITGVFPIGSAANVLVAATITYSNGQVWTITTTTDKTQAAKAFSYKAPVTITTSAGAGGTMTRTYPAGGTATGNQLVYAQDVTFTITPNSGYEIASVTLNGVTQPSYVGIQNAATITLPNVITNQTLAVTFRTASYSLSLSIDQAFVELGFGPESVGGSVKAAYITAAVTTDKASGYSILVQADNGGKLVCQGNAAKSIAPTTAGGLALGSWGIAAGDVQPTSWTSPSATMTAIKSNAAAVTDDMTKIWFGANVDSAAQASCDYTGIVTITAVGNL